MVITPKIDKKDRENLAVLGQTNRPQATEQRRCGPLRYKKREQQGKFIAFPLGKGVFLQ